MTALTDPVTTPAALRGCPRPLAVSYDAALLDLDGVVYLGTEPVEGAAPALAAARARGMRLGFVTNNASRTPALIAVQLNKLGVLADESEVVTSSMAAARLLTEHVPAGSRVLVVGGDGLQQAVEERGFVAVHSASDEPAAVVQGYAATVGWQQLAEASVAVNEGAVWVASNGDLTLPSPRGPLPGNGALIGVVTAATGKRPVIAGKPEPPLHAESVRRIGAQHPLVVGDRLDTDIMGANRGGADSLLVLTGITRPDDLLAAPPSARPSYVAQDLGGLLRPHPETTWDGQAAVVHRTDGEPDDGLDALRARCVAAWAAADAAR